MQKRVPDAVVRRLSRYYRQLQAMETEGITRISSMALSEKMGLTASQIRQDLNFFGGFGQQGYGYHVPELKEAIGKILGLGRKYKMVIVGAGNIGQALLRYSGFRLEGYEIVAMFDCNPRLIGMQIDGINVYDSIALEDYLAKNKVDIAVISTPGMIAQQVAEQLQNAGIKAIWSFVPIEVRVRPDVQVEHVRLSDSLFTLTYRLNETERQS